MNNTEYNPILKLCDKELPNYLYDPEIRQILKSINLTDWNCPVCYNCIKGTNICIPFKCCHIICYTCFKNICCTFQYSRRIKNVKCPLCRKGANQSWIKYKFISLKSYIVKDTRLSVIIPCDKR